MVYLNKNIIICPNPTLENKELYTIKLINLQTLQTQIFSDLSNVSEYSFMFKFNLNTDSVKNGQYKLLILNNDDVEYSALAQKGTYTTPIVSYNNENLIYKVYGSK